MFSKSYIKELQGLHNDKSRPRGFGGKIKDLGEFHSFMEKWQPLSLLDYGCGKGTILSFLKDKYENTRMAGYDPAIPMFSSPIHSNFDCVFSNDVLEHIEPNYLNEVLTHINSIATKFIWLRIDTVPARKTLSDGRNAHLILESKEWWENKIKNNIEGKIVYSVLTKKGKLDVAIEKSNSR